MTFNIKAGVTLGQGNLGVGIGGVPGNGHGNGHGHGREFGKDGNGNAFGAGVGVNIGALDIGVVMGIGGLTGSLGAATTRPNDEPTDADAVARLRRQSESLDLQSGRDVNTSTYANRGTQDARGGQPVAAGTGPGAAATAFAGSQTGGSQGGQISVGVTLGGGAGNGFSAGPAPASPVPVSTGAVDRLWTALADRSTPQAAAGPSETGRNPGAQPAVSIGNPRIAQVTVATTSADPRQAQAPMLAESPAVRAAG